MNKIIYLLLFFVTLSYSQQAKIDSLKIKLSESKNRNDSLPIIIALSKAYYASSSDEKFDETISYLKNKTKHVKDPYIMGSFYQIIALKALDNKNYQNVIDNGSKALTLFVKTNDTLRMGEILNVLVKAYDKLDDVKKSYKIYNNYKERIPLKYKYLICLELANKYTSTSSYSETKNLLNEAFLIAQKLKNKQYKGKVLYRISQLNYLLKNYKEAEKKAYKSIELLDRNKNKVLFGAAIYNLANIFYGEEKHENCIQYLDSAFVYYKGNTRSQAILLTRKSAALLQLNRLTEAKKVAKKAIELHIKNNNNYSLGFAYSSLANIIFYSNKSDTNAIYYMNKAIDIGKKHSIKHLIKASNYNISNFYYANKDYKQAYDKLKIAFKYSDTLYKNKILKDVKEIETKYQTEKKEKENLKLKAEKAQQQLALAQENKQKWMYAAALFASLLFLGMLYYYYQKNKKQKQLVENLQKELHHRVKNNLGVIDSLIEDLKDEFIDTHFNTKLTDLQNRIDSINEVHKQLYATDDITSLHLKKYVEKLANNVKKSFDGENITIENTIKENITLNGKQSFPLGLIINEFLTNTYKYAFPNNEKGNIKIGIQEKNNHFILLLSDNGIGLPKGINIDELNSFGLQIMKLLSKQLKGNFTLNNNKGVHIIIEFPK